ncbi:MAG: hypothetical protein E7324_10425 [Clostridiales bacterium]|nr:hypothetical protein [Clostridiales bacterium]
MLTTPKHGWTDFQLDGTSVYSLSYLSDIPFEWLTQAITALKYLTPFCVKGNMEPGRFLCTVSFWDCHVLCEEEHSSSLKKKDAEQETAPVSMLQFCQELYHDINRDLDAWAAFQHDAQPENIAYRKKSLAQKLQQLKDLIAEKKADFDQKRAFF